MNASWLIKHINEADLNFFEVTPWQRVTSNDPFLSKEQWFNKTFTEYLWLFVSWENCALKPQHTVAVTENMRGTIQSYTTLRCMFSVYLQPDWLWFFFQTWKWNKLVISSSKSLYLCNKIETLPKSSKDTHEGRSCRQSEVLFAIYMQLSLGFNWLYLRPKVAERYQEKLQWCYRQSHNHSTVY